jgi:predicted enzyme related to lactoylglutathione lyase
MGKHSIVHVEIPASDPKEAAQFYTNLFGWGTEGTNTGDGEYWMFKADAGPTGGFNPVGESGLWPVKPGDVLLYISTDDIDATLAKAESLGAKLVTPKTAIPGMGWWAMFSDPTGNKIGLYTSTAQVE